MDKDKAILNVLEAENRWLTFDELYSKVQPDCDWIRFALHLESLVDQGLVQLILERGMDDGYYGISRKLSTPPIR